MRSAALLVLPLFLAACEGREAVSICAAVGELSGEVVAAFHDGDGVRSVLISDAGAGSATVLRDTLEEPILDRLWRLAEPSMRALPETEQSPCGFDTLSTVTVTFADGSSITRQTSCTGNALSRVASEVLAASGIARARDGGEADGQGPVSGILEPCGRLP
jgi:hypothetical protein